MTKTQIFDRLISIFQLKPEQLAAYFSESFDDIDLAENEETINGEHFQSKTYIINKNSWQETGAFIITTFNNKLFNCEFNTTTDIGYDEILEYAVSNYGFAFHAEEVLPMWKLKIFRKDSWQLACSTGALNRLKLSELDLSQGEVVEAILMPSPSK